MDIWKKNEVTPELLYRAKIGGVVIWIKHCQEDWYVAAEPVQEDAELQPLEPVKLSRNREPGKWKRWISGSESRVVQFIPALPDRPLVLKPEVIPRFPPRHEAFLFVSVPVFVRILVGDRDPITLCEVSTVSFSKTWFGDTLSGLSCYSRLTRVLRQLEAPQKTQNRAICQLRIRNNARTELEFQRFCLHVENLSVFQSDKRLWTNAVDISYRGEDKDTQVVISSDAPDIGKTCERLSPPRAPIDKSIVGRSFEALRILTGMEGF